MWLLAHLVDRGGAEDQRDHGAGHRLVELADDLPGLLDRGDERDQRPLEVQVRELDEQRVAHRLGADPGAVGQEKNRHDGLRVVARVSGGGHIGQQTPRHVIGACRPAASTSRQ
jgi:hypothetical protein